MGIIKKLWEIATTDYTTPLYEKALEERDKYEREKHKLRMKYIDEVGIREDAPIRKLLETWNNEVEEIPTEVEAQIPALNIDRAEFIKVFDNIVGYENKKEIISMALLAEKPVHLLLIGKKGTGKTMFMDLLYDYFGSEISVYAVGDSTTDAGLKQLLFETEPKYIFIDEIDKTRSDVQESMLTLMQSGLVSETKVSKTREMTLDNTWVIMTANNKDEINPLLADRCIVIEFPEYTMEQFIKIALYAIFSSYPELNEENQEIGTYIVQRMVSKNIKSVRTAVKVSMMAKTKQDVDLVLENVSIIDN